MKILTGLGHVARYVAGAAVAGGVFMAQAAAIIIPATLLVGVVAVSAVGAIVYFFGGFLVAIVGGVLLMTFVVFPSVLIGELTARRSYPPAAPIVALVVMTGLVSGGSVLWTLIASRPTQEALLPAVLIVAGLILPTLVFGLIAYPAAWFIAKLAARFPGVVGFLKRSAASLGRRFPRLAALARRAISGLQQRPQLGVTQDGQQV